MENSQKENNVNDFTLRVSRAAEDRQEGNVSMNLTDREIPLEEINIEMK